jgi:hypothetical protein
MSHPPALLQFGEMVLGLVRAAELKEQEEGGEIWDDEARRALLAARALELNRTRGAFGIERVSAIILQSLDLTNDHHEVGIFKVAVYPQLNFGTPISYSAEISRTDSGGHLTVFHTVQNASKAEAWEKVHEFVTGFSRQLLEIAELAARLGFNALAKADTEEASDGT